MPAPVPKTCDACGATGQTGGFCDECGETLPVNSAAVSAPEPVPEPAPAPAAKVEATRVQPAISDDSGDTWDMPSSTSRSGGRSSSTGRPGPSFTGRSSSGERSTLSSGQRPDLDPPTLPASGNRPRPSFSAAQPGKGWQPPAERRRPPGGDEQERARALLIPVDDPSALSTTGTVAPVLPGRPEPARPASVRMHETDAVTGGAPCPWCNALNPVGRHFCRKCAMSLAEKPGEAPVRLSWWRRLFGRRGTEVPYAGQRPTLARNPGRIARLLVTLGAVAVVVVAAVVWGPDAVNGIEDHFAKPTITPASTVTANRSDPAHPVSKVHDSFSNTYWATGLKGDGAGVFIGATFDQPIDLLDVIITPGAGTAEDAFTSEGRPDQMQVMLTQANGQSTTQMITVADTPGAQTFPIRGRDISSVKFTIVSSYNAASANSETAIAEIEFFEKS